MISFSTIKTLGGAVALRALETYRLLFTRFLPLVLIFIISGLTIYNQQQTGIFLITTLILTSIIILLSRSSMVRRDWRYLFLSDQTISITLWNGLWLMAIASPLPRYLKLLPASVALFFTLPFVFGVAPAMTLLWAYCLLDTKISWQNLVFFIPQSFYTLILLIWSNLALFLFFTIAILVGLILSIILAIAVHLLLPVLLLAPLYTALAAVTYEEMRYRAGV